MVVNHALLLSNHLTAAQVLPEYEVLLRDGTVELCENPALLPEAKLIEEIREPIVRAAVITPKEYVGAVIQISLERRGVQTKMEYLDTERVNIEFDLPLNELVVDYYDKLKSVTRGYASLDYEFSGHWVSPLVKLDVLVNGDPVDALSLIVHRDTAYQRGKTLVEKMRKIIPRQMFEVAIQAAIGTKIIARTTVKALRKNVTAKCYGGDVTRKRKLLEKQKAGKKRMKQVGRVEIPQSAFLAVLKVDG